MPDLDPVPGAQNVIDQACRSHPNRGRDTYIARDAIDRLHSLSIHDIDVIDTERQLLREAIQYCGLNRENAFRSPLSINFRPSANA